MALQGHLQNDFGVPGDSLEALPGFQKEGLGFSSAKPCPAAQSPGNISGCLPMRRGETAGV